jgi:hypothetical protein
MIACESPHLCYKRDLVGEPRRVNGNAPQVLSLWAGGQRG